MSRRIISALATVLLPHDYLNFWLTGEKVMEYGDASGTALLDVRKRKWSQAVLEAIDPGPGRQTAAADLAATSRPGTLQASTAKQLDLNPGVLVSAGGGDNMMGAIGTGNTRAGRHHRQLRHQRHHLRLRGKAGGRSRRAKSPRSAIPPTAGCRCSAP